MRTMSSRAGPALLLMSLMLWTAVHGFVGPTGRPLLADRAIVVWPSTTNSNCHRRTPPRRGGQPPPPHRHVADVSMRRATTPATTEDGGQRKKRTRRRKPARSDVSGSSSLTEKSDENATKAAVDQTAATASPARPASKRQQPELKPRNDVVVLPMNDINRSSYSRPTTVSASTPTAPSQATTDGGSVAINSMASSSRTKATDDGDSLAQLLADAQELQALESQQDIAGGAAATDTAKSTIRNVLSTIVTVDFFVVCLFLVWFGAGIFGSYVLHDDTIQISFNSNFERLVQPALGILMVAALGDAVFKSREEDN